jgi:hypothetical protein
MPERRFHNRILCPYFAESHAPFHSFPECNTGRTKVETPRSHEYKTIVSEIAIVRALSRRRFSKLLAASALGTLVAPTLLRGQHLNSKLNIAIIGAGGRGGSNMSDVGKTENIVAVCDVAETALDSAQKKFPQAKRFTDFRKLYEAEKEFDAVVVSTCEHTHAFATLPALKLGKHVYCEKPLTYNVWEARVIREARGGRRWRPKWARKFTPAPTIAAWSSLCKAAPLA